MIIPTYINSKEVGKTGLFVRIWNKLGANFKRQFTYNTYQEFFEKAGYADVEYKLVQGRMPCAIAILKK